MVIKKTCYYKIIQLLIIALLPLTANSSSLDKANELYKQNNYTAAIELYNEVVNDTTIIHTNLTYAANVYYNLGNCYYRTKDYAKAVYAYQQSLRLQPSNKDALFNLQLVQSKLPDQFDQPAQTIFSIALRSVMITQSATAWGYWAIAFFILLLVFLQIFRCATKPQYRKSAFSLFIVMLVMFCSSIAFAYVESNYAYSPTQAVIMAPTPTYASPSSTSKVIRQLHEGVLINIISKQPDGWLQVELPDDNQVWINGGQPLLLH